MSAKKRKLLVTGGTGFVGGHVVRGALDRGFEVRVLARATSDTAELDALGVELVRGDLTDRDSLRGCCDGVAAVVHTACAVASTFDAGREALKQFLAVNRDGTLNLAKEVLAQGGVRLVHTSSTAAMGSPTTERVDETTACHPRSPYQISKREAELALLDLHRRADLDVVIVRPCLVAGEGKAGGELLKLFKLVRSGRFPLIGNDPSLSKPLIAVDDLVEALLLAAHRGGAGEIYLVHSDGGHTLGEILATAGQLTGARRTHIPIPLPVAHTVAFGLGLLGRLRPDWNPPLTPERVRLFVTDRHIDISKARRELGFEPRHQDLGELLGRTYNDYRARGAL